MPNMKQKLCLCYIVEIDVQCIARILAARLNCYSGNMFVDTKVLLVLALIVTSLLLESAGDSDYYKILGVSMDASSREVRKAFKKLAITLHPDKNQADPDAHATFVKLTKAYETLKDPVSRKKYDLHGEAGKSPVYNQGYHSWSYYRDNFGIYDDDPEIITLSKAEFEQHVPGSKILWFINFYSPMCSHCHTLAPAWRKLAQKLEGVIRVGAVNCEEDWILCRQEKVQRYPTLVIYPTRKVYQGEKSREDMVQFVLSQLRVPALKLTAKSWEENYLKDYRWLLALCHFSSECLDTNSRIKLATMLEGLVKVGWIDCTADKELCHNLEGEEKVGLIFWEPEVPHKITTLEVQAIAREVLNFLPEPMVLNAKDFEDLHERLRKNSPDSWLLYFHLGEPTKSEMLELKKLPALLPRGMHLGKLDCGHYAYICSKLYILNYPLFVVFKPGGGYEAHHGRELAHDVAGFAQDSSSVPNMQLLDPLEFEEVLSRQNSTLWLIDFYSPWCPPCLRLLPELRKAAREFKPSNVKFGLIDCTIHQSLCQQYNIRSYPTTVIYNSTMQHHFQGEYTAPSLIEFVQDFIDPSVVRLTEENFYSNVGSKREDELWLVSYFTPWCGPCRMLKPQWKKLSKMVSSYENLHVGAVDCEKEVTLCSEQGIQSYPTIRLYPLGSIGLSTVSFFNGYQRDALTLWSWLMNFLPSFVQELTPEKFEASVTENDDPWVVYFYAPWCGHCTNFAPEFHIIAKKLHGVANAGQVNCEAFNHLCLRSGIMAYPTVMFYYGSSRTCLYKGEELLSQSSENIIKHITSILNYDMKTTMLQHNTHDEF